MSHRQCDRCGRHDMTCVTCGNKRAWPGAFPNQIYAVCWQCTWDQHHRNAHPPTWWQRRTHRRELIRKAKAEAKRFGGVA